MRHCLDNSDPCELIFLECQTFFQTLVEKGDEDSYKLIKLHGLRLVTTIYSGTTSDGLAGPAEADWRGGCCWAAGDLASAFGSSASIGMSQVLGCHEESKVLSVPE